MKRDSKPAKPSKPAKVAKPRGRPRSFDREQALEHAMEVFWRKGFEAASLADLTEAMGINPPSLYAAFGDKERLFLEALDRYQAKQGDSCPYAEEPTAKGAIRRLLTYMADDLTCCTHPRGCMMVMAAATSSDCSPRMQAVLAKRRAEGRGKIRQRIELGVKEGELPPETDAGGLADFYLTIVSGMALQARDGASRKSLMATVESAMRAWPASAKGAAREKAAA